MIAYIDVYTEDGRAHVMPDTDTPFCKSKGSHAWELPGKPAFYTRDGVWRKRVTSFARVESDEEATPPQNVRAMAGDKVTR